MKLHIFGLLVFIPTSLTAALYQDSKTTKLEARRKVRAMKNHDLKAHVRSRKLMKGLHTTIATAFPDEDHKPITNDRLDILTTNLLQILAFNSAQNSSIAGLNRFSLHTIEENTARILMKPKSTNNQKRSSTTQANFNSSLYANNTFLDWRHINNRSYVTSVKNQICGTCWAYSAVGALESAILIANQSLTTVQLSMPHAIAGGMNYTATMCDGGWFDVFKFAKDHSIALDQYYPLNSTNFAPDNSSFPLVNNYWPNKNFPNFQAISSLNYGGAYQTGSKFTLSTPTKEGIIAALRIQPVLIEISVGAAIFHYNSGILSLEQCGNGVNHMFLLVGYSLDQNYWIIRNSWGVGYGENGYIRITMRDSSPGFCSMYVNGAQSPTLDIAFTRTNQFRPICRRLRL